jgi:3-oxoacyl-[acyl-carrier-protein] synthase-3
MTMGKGCAILGWGTALPDQVVSNDQMASRFDTTDEWIVERSGIRTRHVMSGPFFVSPDTDGAGSMIGTTGRLAVRAAAAALRSSGTRPGEVGMVILCTATPDKQMPPTAAMVAAELGIHCGAMDVNAVCAGFMHGIVTAAGFIAGGTERVLLIGSETMTRAVDWSDRASAFLFGDGAGAVVLGGVEGEGSLLGWDLGVDGSLSHILYADHGSGMIMKGREVFRHAIRVTVESAGISMGKAGVTASNIDLFVPHQANARITESVAGRLGIGADRIASTIDWTGNTSSASIPLALISSIEAGRLHQGSLVLLAGFGSGLSWGSAVWRWSGDSLHPAGSEPTHR